MCVIFKTYWRKCSLFADFSLCTQNDLEELIYVDGTIQFYSKNLIFKRPLKMTEIISRSPRNHKKLLYETLLCNRPSEKEIVGVDHFNASPCICICARSCIRVYMKAHVYRKRWNAARIHKSGAALQAATHITSYNGHEWIEPCLSYRPTWSSRNCETRR